MKSQNVLTLMICTCSERIERVQKILLPEHEKIRYVISWQNPPDNETEVRCRQIFSQRNDVLLTVLRYHNGLSANRNHAFRFWDTEYGLICDDDEIFTTERLLEIIRQFDLHPNDDILCFKAENLRGEPLRTYPDKSFEYGCRPRFTYFCSFEIALRKNVALPYFDERFGLQSAHLCSGEEEVFLEQAHQNGLSIRYLPIFICQTADLTTTTSPQNAEKLLLAKGALQYIMHGKIGALLRCLKFALTNQFFKAGHIFRFQHKGIRYIEQSKPVHVVDVESEPPLLSIVVPTHNRTDLLPRTLASLEAMSYRNIDLIFADDNSTENNLEILRDFKQRQEHRFRSISIISNNPERTGAANSRNTGFDAVKTDYVYFFDSDDEISPDYTLEAAQMLRENQPDLLCNATEMVFPNGKRKERSMPRPLNVASHILAASLSTQSVIIRSEYLRKVGGWNGLLRQWDDWELGVRLLLHTDRILWMPQKNYHRIYQHENGLTGENLEQTYKNYYAVFETVRNEIENALELPEMLRVKAFSALVAKIYLFNDNLLKYGYLDYSKEFISFSSNIPVNPRLKFVIDATKVLPLWAKKGMWRIFYLFL